MITSDNSGGVPYWRSLLFVPAHLSRFIDKAHERGADAIILDLEDSVPLDKKPDARHMLAASVMSAGQHGASVLVRVNHGLRAIAADLEVAVSAGVDALVLPKVESADWIIEIAAAVLDLEQERGLASGAIRLVAQIESPKGLMNLPAIAAAHPRQIALTLGPEDFSASVGGSPVPELLLAPNLSVLFAARAAGLLPLGFVGSIADYSDLDTFRARIIQAKQLGFAGACAIHPSQVSILNETFTPDAEELAWADKILQAESAALAKGYGAFSLHGTMIDAPVLRRAREVRARASIALNLR